MNTETLKWNIQFKSHNLWDPTDVIVINDGEPSTSTAATTNRQQTEERASTSSTSTSNVATMKSKTQSPVGVSSPSAVKDPVVFSRRSRFAPLQPTPPPAPAPDFERRCNPSPPAAVTTDCLPDEVRLKSSSFQEARKKLAALSGTNDNNNTASKVTATATFHTLPLASNCNDPRGRNSSYLNSTLSPPKPVQTIVGLQAQAQTPLSPVPPPPNINGTWSSNSIPVKEFQRATPKRQTELRRIMQRRKSMMPVSSKPLVDKQELFGGSSLDYEDLVEHKREQERQEKQQASVTEPETTQEKRINKNLAVMFEKSNDNCSISTHNILAGKRRSRLNGLTLNETEMYRNAFQLSALKPTSAAALSTKSNATAATKRKRGRPAAGKCADAALLEKQPPAKRQRVKSNSSANTEDVAQPTSSLPAHSTTAVPAEPATSTPETGATTTAPLAPPPPKRKAKRNELDKLTDDIAQMYYANDVMRATGRRACTTQQHSLAEQDSSRSSSLSRGNRSRSSSIGNMSNQNNAELAPYITNVARRGHPFAVGRGLDRASSKAKQQQTIQTKRCQLWDPTDVIVINDGEPSTSTAATTNRQQTEERASTSSTSTSNVATMKSKTQSPVGVSSPSAVKDPVVFSRRSRFAPLQPTPPPAPAPDFERRCNPSPPAAVTTDCLPDEVRLKSSSFQEARKKLAALSGTNDNNNTASKVTATATFHTLPLASNCNDPRGRNSSYLNSTLSPPKPVQTIVGLQAQAQTPLSPVPPPPNINGTWSSNSIPVKEFQRATPKRQTELRRIMQRRKSMMPVSSKPLVDKQELFGGSSLDYEDLVEHKREQERQEKQQASVTEPETTQEKRINKNLAVMFEKSNDNCSISTHNILAGKRRSRLNGLTLNETEMYRNAFQLSALKPTSAAALSTKSNATAATKRKRGRPAAGKCADAALLEKQPPAKRQRVKSNSSANTEDVAQPTSSLPAHSTTAVPAEPATSTPETGATTTAPLAPPPPKRKAKRNELDKLTDDIAQMYYANDVMRATGRRACTTQQHSLAEQDSSRSSSLSRGNRSRSSSIGNMSNQNNAELAPYITNVARRGHPFAVGRGLDRASSKAKQQQTIQTKRCQLWDPTDVIVINDGEPSTSTAATTNRQQTEERASTSSTSTSNVATMKSKTQSPVGVSSPSAVKDPVVFSRRSRFAPLQPTPPPAPAPDFERRCNPSPPAAVTTDCLPDEVRLKSSSFQEARKKLAALSGTNDNNNTASKVTATATFHTLPLASNCNDPRGRNSSYLNSTLSPPKPVQTIVGLQAQAQTPLSPVPPPPNINGTWSSNSIPVKEFQRATPKRQTELRRIMQRRKSMMPVSSKPLVDKQELFGGSSLDYEDLVEHKREQERQEKQQASVTEPETTQEKRINKNLAVMFEKSNDNCSISTHNILAGKRRSRLNGLTLNETEMYRNAFQLSALKPTSAAALSTKSNATAATKRKRGRPAAGKCADAALLEKQPPAKRQRVKSNSSANTEDVAQPTSSLPAHSTTAVPAEPATSTPETGATTTAPLAPPPPKRKAKRNELDKLTDDIAQMYYANDVMRATGRRACTTQQHSLAEQDSSRSSSLSRGNRSRSSSIGNMSNQNNAELAPYITNVARRGHPFAVGRGLDRASSKAKQQQTIQTKRCQLWDPTDVIVINDGEPSTSTAATTNRQQTEERASTSSTSTSNVATMKSKTQSPVGVSSPSAVKDPVVFSRRSRFAPLQPTPPPAPAPDFERRCNPSPPAAVTTDCLPDEVRLKSSSFQEARKKLAALSGTNDNNNTASKVTATATFHTLPLASNCNDPRGRNSSYLNSTLSPPKPVQTIVGLQAQAQTPLSPVPPPPNINGTWSSNSIPVKEFQRATPKRQTELRRIMQRRKSMMPVSSKPLVDKQELFGGSSLDYEDLVEHKREQERQEKQQASVTEPETTQEKRINKNLAVMFEKSNDNCSISTHNILAGKRRSRLNGLTLNETEMYRNAFQLSALKPTSAAALSTKSNATAATKRKRGRPAAGKCADAALLEKQPPAKRQRVKSNSSANTEDVAQPTSSLPAHSTTAVPAEPATSTPETGATTTAPLAPPPPKRKAKRNELDKLTDDIAQMYYANDVMRATGRRACTTQQHSLAEQDSSRSSSLSRGNRSRSSSIGNMSNQNNAELAPYITNVARRGHPFAVGRGLDRASSKAKQQQTIQTKRCQLWDPTDVIVINDGEPSTSTAATTNRQQTEERASTSSTSTSNVATMKSKTQSPVGVSSPSAVKDPVVFSRRSRFAPLQPTPPPAPAPDFERRCNPSPPAAVTTDCLPDEVRLKSSSFQEARKKLAALSGTNDNNNTASKVTATATFHTLPLASNCNDPRGRNSSYLNSTLSPPKPVQTIVGLQAQAQTPLSPVPPPPNINGTWSSNSIPVKEFQRATPKRQTELRRIMQRRKSMMPVSSKPLVDKQELFGGSSLDYEDLVEHKREQERQEKQQASVTEPETTQEKRINKNLAVMFEKSNDNCSISTHNILAGKRRSRLNGLTLNETEMYRNAFQLSALKPTSAAALSTKSNATAATKRKRGRPAAGKCADAALLEKQPPAKRQRVKSNSSANTEDVAQPTSSLPAHSTTAVPAEPATSTPETGATTTAPLAPPPPKRKAKRNELDKLTDDIAQMYYANDVMRATGRRACTTQQHSLAEQDSSRSSSLSRGNRSRSSSIGNMSNQNNAELAPYITNVARRGHPFAVGRGLDRASSKAKQQQTIQTKRCQLWDPTDVIVINDGEPSTSTAATTNRQQTEERASTSSTSTSNVATMKSKTQSPVGVSSPSAVKDPVVFSRRSRFAPLQPTPPPAPAPDFERRCNPSPPAAVTTDCLPDEVRLKSSSFQEARKKLAALSGTNDNNNTASKVTATATFHTLPLASNCNDPRGRNSSYLNSTLSPPKPVQTIVGLQAQAQTPLSPVPPPPNINGTWSSNSIPVKEFQRATPKRQTELRRIMQRRKSMMPVSSKPLVDKQELFGGSSLDYEDLVEHKREQERQEKQQASVTEPETTQEKRINKNLAVMFEKSNDNCSISTHNILAGKRRSRLNGLTLNETEMYRNAFQLSALKPTSAAALSTKSNATAATKRKRGRPAAGKCADAALLEKQPPAKRQRVKSNSSANTEDVAQPTSSLPAHSTTAVPAEPATSTPETGATTTAPLAPPPPKRKAKRNELDKLTDDIAQMYYANDVMRATGRRACTTQQHSLAEQDSSRSSSLSRGNRSRSSSIGNMSNQNNAELAPYITNVARRGHPFAVGRGLDRASSKAKQQQTIQTKRCESLKSFDMPEEIWRSKM
ncbi:hypothetical protein ACLKA6_013990 [Drosophila palustris]